jgi:hypothetical protein
MRGTKRWLGWVIGGVALLFAALPLRDGTGVPGSSSLEARRESPRARPAGRAPLAPPPGRSNASALAQFEQRARPALERFLRERAPRSGSRRLAALAPRDVRSAQAVALLERAGALRERGERFQAGDESVRRLQLEKSGLPVFNRGAVLRERGGALVGRGGWASLPPLRLEPAALARDSAIAIARQATQTQASTASPRARRGWLALGGETLPVWRVIVPSLIPHGEFQVDVDAVDGRVLARVDLLRRAAGTGSVYDPNIALSPTPSIVPLRDLDGSGRLGGSYARVFDERSTEAFVPSLAFIFPPADPRFKQTSVYRGLTDMAGWTVARGFPAFPQPLPAFTNLPDPATGTGEYNNAFYSPTYGLFGFGNGDGIHTANLSTDLDVAAHEMAHHVFELLAVPQPVFETDPVIAMNEGVADTFAALLTNSADIGESTIPGRPYLRTLANGNTFLNTSDPDPHTMGLIYGGANWDIAQGIGHDAFASVLLAALAQLPSDPFEFEYRDAVLAANLAVRSGAQQAQLGAIFSARGFDDTEFPLEWRGVLDPGIGASNALSNDAFHFYGFSEFPGSTLVNVTTTGSGDVDLYVAPFSDTSTFLSSQGVTSNESVSVMPFTSPSVNDDDAWLIVVQDWGGDFVGSSYTVRASYTLPPAQISSNGTPAAGSLTAIGETDFFLFEATSSGQVFRVEANSASAGFDPVVGVFDPLTFELLGANDDSGIGLDALLQGVQVPRSGLWAVAVASFAGDIHPSAAIGSYSVRVSICPNTGANFDGDALVDACDDDDDNDSFLDDEDTSAKNAALCADFDSDSCDDCSSGSWDWFADGPDGDADGECDLGDPDDDNDGCSDGVDPAPFAPSADDDLDFLGSDCDNCAHAANPLQEDRGSVGAGSPANGRGDACECGDVTGDGRVTTADAVVITRSLLVPPTAALAQPQLCDVGGSAACSTADAAIVTRALLVPATAQISEVCAPAVP